MKTAPGNSGLSFAARTIPEIGAAPLFIAACVFSAGIVLARYLWITPPHLLIGVAALAILCGVAAVRAPRLAGCAIALLFTLLGAWCAEMQPQPAPSSEVLALSTGLLRTVDGTVTAAGLVRDPGLFEPDDAAGESPSQTIDVRLNSIEKIEDAVDQQVPVQGSVRLNIRWPKGSQTRIACGERVRILARLLPPVTYHDPGVWNRAEYLVQQGITSVATVPRDQVERLAASPAFSLPCLLGEAQRNASARLMSLPVRMQGLPAQLRLSAEDAAMLTAMITGDRSFLARNLRVGFERTGSFHMLVVSGFHLAVVAGCIFWFSARLRIPRLPATLMTLAGSFAYALFTGFATPVQRSLAMVSLYLVARLFYRERSVLNTIGFAGLGLLVVSPRALFESSFQMTLLAVVSIGGIAVPLLRETVQPYLSSLGDLRSMASDIQLAPRVAQFRVTLRMIAARIQPIVGRWCAWILFPWTIRFALRVAEAVVISMVIELAMTLPMALYFHRLTLTALPVNLLILPLLALLIPVALITLLVLMMWPAGALVPAVATGFLLHLGFGLVRVFGSLSWGDVRIPDPPFRQIAMYCISLGAAMVLVQVARPWARRAAWVALLIGASAAVTRTSMRHPHDALLVQAFDVGQGDSLLVITPDGKTLLVDGGGYSGAPRKAAPQFDIGDEVVSAALWSRGIRHLDAVALSHAHSDHMGGLPAILRNFHPGELWVGNNPPTAAYEALLDQARHGHIQVRTFSAGDAFRFGSADMRVLAPAVGYLPGKEPANNDSLVLHIAYGSTSVLLEGDAEAPIEQAMLEEAGLSSSLLKVGHHGSITSTRPEFLARVAPQWAIISCGLRNRYGHPRGEVLSELQAAHVRTISTDVAGSACLRLDGTTVQREACEADPTP